MLPTRIAVPPFAALFPESTAPGCVFRQAWDYVYNSALAVPNCVVAIDDALEKIGWSAHQVRVDGVVIALETSDFHTLDPHTTSYPLWLRFTYTPYFAAFPMVGSFPITSFTDWAQYRRYVERAPYPARSNTVVFACQVHDSNVAGHKTRRHLVRDRLQAVYGADYDGAWTSFETYMDRCYNSAVTVCVPGACNNRLDRSQWQLMGAGVCTISPELFDAPLEDRPIAGEHYMRCRDDYADLLAVVEECLSERRRCREIGANAAEFFLTHGTPRAIWSYIKGRLP
jgi:hypothetical protein